MSNSNKICGVYKITNPNGQIYIGGSKNLPFRWKYYKSVSSKGHRKLYLSIQKYGLDNHKFEIIEECTFENLGSREYYYGMLFNVLSEENLNCALPKENGKNGTFSEETKAKMSERMKGNKNPSFGKPASDWQKERIRLAQTGRKHTEEHRRKVSENNAKNNSKLVLNTETGIYYDSIKDAAIAHGIIHSTLKNRVNGSSPTYTPVKIV
jgi:group I intron endonuclease